MVEKLIKLNQKNRGQSLFEVVVSIAISAIIIVALVALAANSIKNATFAKNKTIASRYAEEVTEWLRGQRDNNTNVFFTNTLVSASWCLPTPDWPVGPSASCDEFIEGTIFTRRVDVTRQFIGLGKTLISTDVVVSWDDAQGNHEVRSTTSFSDWRER
jgi:type II secretory pathway pseudopilin PulG